MISGRSAMEANLRTWHLSSERDYLLRGEIKMKNKRGKIELRIESQSNPQETENNSPGTSTASM